MTLKAHLTTLHRWAGLVTAMFLFTSGVTGAIISWDHEIDEMLNPHLFNSRARGTAISATELAKVVEQRDPRVRVTYFPLKAEAEGHSIRFFVAPRIDPQTGRRHQISYNQVFLDPVTGDEMGRRSSAAAWPITRENVVSFVYRFHYTLQIPEFWGSNRWGYWLLGGIAMIWTLDCFIGFYLTLPTRRKPRTDRPAIVERELERGFWHRWKPAWLIKRGGSAYRINFDIHRAFGLWTWGLLFIIAFTGFSLNLYREIFVPVMRTISTYTPTPYDLRKAAPLDQPILPQLSFAEVIERADREARGRGWPKPASAVGYNGQYGIYSVRYYASGDDHGTGGAGPSQLYYDGADGKLLGDKMPWRGTVADIFVQAQFPLHSGRILGLPGRILISLMGLVVAALSVTGIVIWWRKRSARFGRKRRQQVGAGAAIPVAQQFSAILTLQNCADAINWRHRYKRTDSNSASRTARLF
jgi:uncharacterized iron-regulated membrane protein